MEWFMHQVKDLHDPSITSKGHTSQNNLKTYFISSKEFEMLSVKVPILRQVQMKQLVKRMKRVQMGWRRKASEY